MDILIRRSEKLPSGDVTTLEQALENATLDIGSALDQPLRLADESVAERHASITLSGGRIQLACRRDCSVSLDGQPVRKATLAPGDVLLVGDHRLTIVSPPTGFDLAVEVSREGKSGAPPASFRRTRLTDTWLAPRATAWVLSLAVLLLALAAPLAHHLLERRAPVETAAVTNGSEEEQAIAAVADAALNEPDDSAGWLGLLGDSLWSSGPLHDSHAALEDDCGACHEKLFQRVTNASCERCHAGTVDHVSARAAERNAHLSPIMNGRCASCHREHDEPSTLVNRSSALCTDCHANGALSDGHETMAPVTAFGTDTHPGFDVTLPRPPREPGGEWTFETLPLVGASESSGLRFDHAAHADGEVMGRADGQGLGCADCHVARSDGEHFEPVAFETNCATSGCHQLELDRNHRIPHGMPDVAVAAIEGFYLREFGHPDAERTAAFGIDRRRRPGRGTSDDERFDCDASNFDCALGLAARKVEQQFTRTGCVTCHLVESSGEPAGDTPDSVTLPFVVAPVRLADDFHPAARFDHDSHGVLVPPGGGRAATEDRACLHCHEADASTRSEDLLMPEIDTCTDCHDGLSRTANVPLGCVDCHGYHPASSPFRTGKDS